MAEKLSRIKKATGIDTSDIIRELLILLPDIDFNLSFFHSLNSRHYIDSSLSTRQLVTIFSTIAKVAEGSINVSLFRDDMQEFLPFHKRTLPYVTNLPLVTVLRIVDAIHRELNKTKTD
jgi:hypothetical protein